MIVTTDAQLPFANYSELWEWSQSLLWNLIQSDPSAQSQWNRITNDPDARCMCDPSCLCMGGAYWALSQIIPNECVVYDLGCAHAWQAMFFKEHARYVGVDLLTERQHQLHIPRSEHHHMSIRRFIESATIEGPHFAICLWVPPWHNDNAKLVREAFVNVHTFYPGDDMGVPTHA